MSGSPQDYSTEQTSQQEGSMAEQQPPASSGTPSSPAPHPSTPPTPTFDPAQYQAALKSTTPATFARTAAAYASSPSLGPVRNPDFIDNILVDHSQALTLFSHFFQAAEANATHIMTLVVGALALELRLHSQAEVQVLYPVLAQRLGNEGCVLAQRALAEHAMLENSIEEMLRLRGAGDKEGLITRVKQCQTEMMTHNAEEESMILPRVVAVCTPEELAQLGIAFRTVKQSAPLMPQTAALKAAMGVAVEGAAARPTRHRNEA